MTSRLRLDVVPQVDEQIVHGPQEGGTDDRRAPIVRNVAGLYCVDSDPMAWGLGVDVALDVLGLGPRILGPKA